METFDETCYYILHFSCLIHISPVFIHKIIRGAYWKGDYLF